MYRDCRVLVGVVVLDFLLGWLAAAEVGRIFIAVAAAVDVAHGQNLAIILLKKPLQIRKALIADADASDVDAIAGGAGSEDRRRDNIGCRERGQRGRFEKTATGDFRLVVISWRVSLVIYLSHEEFEWFVCPATIASETNQRSEDNQLRGRRFWHGTTVPRRRFWLAEVRLPDIVVAWSMTWLPSPSAASAVVEPKDIAPHGIVCGVDDTIAVVVALARRRTNCRAARW